MRSPRFDGAAAGRGERRSAAEAAPQGRARSASNPSLSAKNRKGPLAGPFLFFDGEGGRDEKPTVRWIRPPKYGRFSKADSNWATQSVVSRN